MAKTSNGPAIKFLKLGDIVVPPDRQRSKLAGIDELAASIEKIGLIHPVVVRQAEGGQILLVAGERRFRAHELLVLQDKKKYETIATRAFNDLSENEAKLVELEENIKRHDLTWQEHAIAVEKLMRLHKELDPSLTMEAIASKLGYDIRHIRRMREIAEQLYAGNERVMTAASIVAAYNVIERDRERKVNHAFDTMLEDMSDDEPNNFTTGKAPSTASDDDDADDGEPIVPRPLPSGTGATRGNTPAIINTSFIEWAAAYDGPKFNLIHCDFPYGVDHGKSAQGGAAQYGAYDDSPDIYWELCKSLCDNRDRLMLRTCHVMFWYSMKWHEETLEFFRTNAPDLEIQDHPLIWLKSDNKGIVSDVTRRPRHIYETALLMSRGDRKIIQAVGDGYAAPTDKSNALHISEKPIPVLKHFFRMFIDEHSRVLDPTAGSGTAIIAAEEMGAEAAVGIELNAEYAGAANKRVQIARNLKAASAAVTKGA